MPPFIYRLKPEPQGDSAFGKRVFVQVIKLTSYVRGYGWGPDPIGLLSF